MSELSLLDIAQRVVAEAAPGEQVEAFVARSSESTVRVYHGDIEQLVSAQSEGVGIRVVRDGRLGFAYAGTLDPGVLRETLAEARDNCSFAMPDDAVGFATPDGVPVQDLGLWRDELDTTPTSTRIELATRLEALAGSLDPRVSVYSAEYADGRGESAVANSLGVARSGRESVSYVTVSTLAVDGDETQMGFGYSIGRAPSEIDVEVAARDGIERATRLLGAVKPTTRRVTVLLDPWVTAQFLMVLSSTLSGEAVLKGRSLFADRVGDEVATAAITLIDDPVDPDAFTATEIDAEGLATRRNVLIRDGVLQGFVHNTYTARRSGTASTGSAIRAGFKGSVGVGCLALSLAPGLASQAELVAGIDDGILVQEVSGLHSGVNPVSGDFSTGASGLVIRNGTLAEPVREFTVASTLQRMLRDVVAIGADLTRVPMPAAGASLVIGDVSVSGT